MNTTMEELFRSCFEQLRRLERRNQQDIEDARTFIGGTIHSRYVRLRELNGERLRKARNEILELQQILQLLEL